MEFRARSVGVKRPVTIRRVEMEAMPDDPSLIGVRSIWDHAIIYVR